MRNYVKYALAKGWICADTPDDAALPISLDRFKDYAQALINGDYNWISVRSAINKLKLRHFDLKMDWKEVLDSDYYKVFIDYFIL